MVGHTFHPECACAVALLSAECPGPPSCAIICLSFPNFQNCFCSKPELLLSQVTAEVISEPLGEYIWSYSSALPRHIFWVGLQNFLELLQLKICVLGEATFKIDTYFMSMKFK